MTTNVSPLGDTPLGAVEAPTDPPAVSDDVPGGMRVKLSEQAARIIELEAQVASGEGENRAITMNQAFRDIELDPARGMGKAVAATFEGEAEDLAAFAESEFGYVFTPEHPLARQISNEQRRADELSATAGSVAVPSQADDLAKAEAKGDYATTMQIKGSQIADMFRGGR